MRILTVAFIAGLIAISMPFAAADERDDVLAAIQACLVITDNTERLACMDAATAQLDAQDEQKGTEVEPVAPETPTATPPVPTPQVPTGPSAAEIDARERQLARERAALEQEREELAEQRAALEATEKEKESRSPFWIPESPPEIPVTIRKIVKNRFGVHTFYTTDDDIFEQTDTRRRFIPPSSLPATAIVHQERIGSKWLEFDDVPNKLTKITIRRD